MYILPVEEVKNINYIPLIIEGKLPYEVNSIYVDFLELDKVIKLIMTFV